MNRNVESHFALNPTRIDMSRSTFDRSASVKTSFNVGDIVPFFLEEVLPGDTFNVRTSKVVRMQTLLTPMMDNVYLDSYYFFVPNRLVWKHWKEFNGENTESAWLPTTEYSIPQITSPTGGWSVGTLADYFGLPTGIENLSVSALPFRAYALVMNEWFRDQSLQDPLVVPVDDATVAGVNTGNFVTDCAKGGKPYIAAKYHDYFTSCLPSPQKGPDVTLSVASQGDLPVVPKNETVDPNLFDSTVNMNFKNLAGQRPTRTWIGAVNKGSLTVTDSGMLGVDKSASGAASAPFASNLWAINSGNAIRLITIVRPSFLITKDFIVLRSTLSVNLLVKDSLFTNICKYRPIIIKARLARPMSLNALLISMIITGYHHTDNITMLSKGLNKIMIGISRLRHTNNSTLRSICTCTSTRLLYNLINVNRYTISAEILRTLQTCIR